MRSVRCALVGSIFALCAGCAGTIDDPASFASGKPSPVLGTDSGTREDSGTWPRDAGTAEMDADAPAEDAAAPSGDAAEPSVDAGEPADAAAWPRDAASADAGEPAADSAAPAPDATEGCDFKALIMARCGNAGCHGAPAVSSALDLTSPDLATRLADRQGSLSCSSHLLIDKAQPDQSALYLKVTADACGSRMPLGGTLTDGEQACILHWIEGL